MRSTNPRDVAFIFRDYSRRIHARAVPADPSFLRLSVACGKVCSSFFSPTSLPTSLSPPSFLPSSPSHISPPHPAQIEQWCERHYPSFVRLGQVSGSIQFNPADTRSKVAEADSARDAARAREKRIADLRVGGTKALADAEGTPFGETLMYVGTAFLLVLAISLGAAWLMMQFFGNK